MQQDINGLLQAIYDEYQKPLRILAIDFGIPVRDADDVVQETIISYYEHYPLDWMPGPMRSMLVKILRNKSIDYLRKSQKEKLMLESMEYHRQQEINLRCSQDLFDHITNKEVYYDVNQAFGQLSKDLRAAARMQLVEGMMNKDVAKQLGISSVACRARVSRARKILRQLLGPKYGL